MVAFSELSARIFFENDARWEAMLSPLPAQHHQHQHHHGQDGQHRHGQDDLDDQKKNGVFTSWGWGCTLTCENSCVD